MHLLVFIVLGTPLSWHKIHGGVQSHWIGYFFDVGRFEVGIGTTRAAWAVRWLEDKARERGDLSVSFAKNMDVSSSSRARWNTSAPSWGRCTLGAVQVPVLSAHSLRLCCC